MTSPLATITRSAAFSALAFALPMAVAGQAAPPSVAVQRAWYGGLRSPGRLALDTHGVLYITDPARGEVVARSADGRLLERHGDIGRPLSIAVDIAGRILVGDSRNGSVTAYDSAWQAQFQLGIGLGEFALPADISVEPVSGRIYVADSARGEVRAYDAAGTFQLAFDGAGSADGPLLFPTGVHALEGAGQIVVIDQQNRKVRFFADDGTQLYSFGDHGDLPGEIYAPQGVWVDGGGRLYLADSRLGRVSIFDVASGSYLGSAGTFGTRPGQLRLPMDLVMDAHQRLFVTSADNGRLEIFGIDGAADPDRFVPAHAGVATDVSAVPPLLTSIITVPGYRPESIEATTVEVDGVPPLALTVGDHDGDHVADLQAVFDLTQVTAAQDDGRPILLFQGTLADGLEFQAFGRIPGLMFFDGFESGDVSAWSAATGRIASPGTLGRGIP